ncbi:MAG: nucleotidyltransferase domain-containing protein [Nitrospirae bacterium]|nr:nucleotidyltransferase domain-containing protein [Nitrospirota bacterium]MBF0535008.1 nucleotidyltransferase domain-containing protein [Nitrospirota bacterium]MBF0616516.1 nucleotidyltransferase domain-containing protein [Nitrospirota bacterium]
MEQKIIDVIDRFKSLLSDKISVSDIVVYGSRVRGDSSEHSDLDVLVVVDISNHYIDNIISDCAWEAGFPDDIVVVPIVVTVGALKESPIRESSFIKAVYREGILV